MAVSVGTAATDPPPEPPPRSQGRTRRDLVRAAATALALTPLVAASRPREPTPHTIGLTFDETYRGRRIHGIATVVAGRALGALAWQVSVDGRPLHLMRRADGGWLSVLDHYGSYDTPLDAARAAVDELGPGRHLRGGHHGVHP